MTLSPNIHYHPEEHLTLLINEFIKPEFKVTKQAIDKILVYCNSWNRLDTFMQIAPKLKGKRYWQTLRKAYDWSDNLYRHR